MGVCEPVCVHGLGAVVLVDGWLWCNLQQRAKQKLCVVKSWEALVLKVNILEKHGRQI